MRVIAALVLLVSCDSNSAVTSGLGTPPSVRGPVTPLVNEMTRLATARADLDVLANRVRRWFRVHAECATLDDLKASQILQMSDSSQDPWGHPYVITCFGKGADFEVRSSGRDGIRGNADDVWLVSPRKDDG